MTYQIDTHMMSNEFTPFLDLKSLLQTFAKRYLDMRVVQQITIVSPNLQGYAFSSIFYCMGVSYEPHQQHCIGNTEQRLCSGEKL